MADQTVALILPSFAGGGAERIALALAAGLGISGIEPVLVPFVAEGPLRDEVPPGVAVLPQGIDHRRGPWALVRRLAATLDDLDPAVVLSFTTAANVTASLARRRSRRRFPLALGEHGDPRRPIGHPLLGRLLLPVVGRCYREADRVVAVSRGLGEALARRFRIPPGRLAVIPNGVNTAALARAAAADPGHRFLDPGEPPCIVAVGRLLPVKGFELLVDAWAELAREGSCRLLIIGDGPSRTALAARIRRTPRPADCDLPGYLPDPARHLARAAAVAVPSRREGFSLVIAEAMACGAPVVAADCDFGPRELIEEGVSGLLVREGDSAALAAGLRRVLTEPALAATLREGGPRRAAAFSEEAMLGGYRALVGSLIEKRA